MTGAAFRRWLGRLAAAGLCWVLAAAGAAAAPALWAVKDADSTIYLFGTIHLLPGGQSWRTPKFDDAYARSATVWFEIDAAQAFDRAAAVTLMTRYGVDPDHPLSGRLDARRRRLLAARAGSLGMPPARLDRLRPWSAAMMLSMAPAMKAGFRPEAGADLLLTAQVAADHKTPRYFETAEQQIRFLAELPEAAQMQMLTDTLDTRPSAATRSVAGLESAWRKGDLPRLGPLVLKGMKQRYPALYAAMIRRRNEAWAEALTHEMSGSGVELVAVGALHMVGDDGLPALLRARGFTVERIQ
jgi:hypothetical protein